MHKILEDLIRRRKALKEILLGFAAILIVLASKLSYYYFTVVSQRWHFQIQGGEKFIRPRSETNNVSIQAELSLLPKLTKDVEMYKVLCNKCHGTGEYERPCQCFADNNCPKCHGEGYYQQMCNRCKGEGMIAIKQNDLNDNEMIRT